MNSGEKLGASRTVALGDEWEWPLHGLRHPAEEDTNGWFVWTGELRDDPDFFVPWHAHHLLERCPELEAVLQRPPGTRFIYAPDYLDVWEDTSLLDV